jgi:hypothetical protein
VVDGQNSLLGQCDRRCYVLSKSAKEEAKGIAGNESAEALVLAASIWSEQSHNEAWVYVQGRWGRDKELWRVVQGARWDLISDEG